MRRFRVALISGLLCFAALALSPSTSHALPPEGDGYVAFQGTADLSRYPCPDTGTLCYAEFHGSSAGTFSGVTGTTPWSVTWALAPMEAKPIWYADSCALPVGLASGSGNMATGVGGVFGTYGPTPNVSDPKLPAPVVGISAPFEFTWRRVGTVAVITATLDLILTYATDTGGFQTVQVMNDEITVATATFAPTGPPHDCTSPGPLGAVVVGTATA
jgi:hypothetical protein